jgi:hypothetical protein
LSKSAFEKREQAFEAVFFAKLDAERIEALHEKEREDRAKAGLSATTGISDADLLKRVLDIGVDAHTLQALSLVPLVITAWASGKVTDEQRAATLEAAEARGVSRESDAYELLEAWLDEKPPRKLEKTWSGYVQALRDHLDEAAAEALAQDLMGRCRDVAKASGGILGIHKVSNDEEAAIRRLEEAMG